MTYVETNYAVIDGPIGIDTHDFDTGLITNKTDYKRFLVAGIT